MFRTITPILSILIALFVFFFFVQPRLDTIKVIRAETEKYDDAVNRATELNALLSNLLAQKNQITNFDQDRLSALVPSEVDEVKLLVDLNEIARSHNMLIGNIMVEQSGVNSFAEVQTGNADAVTIEDFAYSDISFGLIGTYEQFKAMLQDMEQSLVLMEIVNLAFSSGRGTLQQFDITVRAYALPQVN
jgi:Tfp pilus assembly protein PilO